MRRQVKLLAYVCNVGYDPMLAFKRIVLTGVRVTLQGQEAAIAKANRLAEAALDQQV